MARGVKGDVGIVGDSYAFVDFPFRLSCLWWEVYVSSSYSSYVEGNKADQILSHGWLGNT